jgi:hypothetical protein
MTESRGVVEAMKSQPALLAMILINLIMVAFLYYQESSNNQYRADVGKEMLAHIQRTTEMLSQCKL